MVKNLKLFYFQNSKYTLQLFTILLWLFLLLL